MKFDNFTRYKYNMSYEDDMWGIDIDTYGLIISPVFILVANIQIYKGNTTTVITDRTNVLFCEKIVFMFVFFSIFR